MRKNNVFTVLIWVILATLIVGYATQGIRSAYRLTQSCLGYSVRAFDVTTSWIGTRNLLIDRVDPYSGEGQALIEEAYFGRPLNPADGRTVKDKHHFVYPLYEIFIYAPTVFMSFPDALLVVWGLGFFALVMASLLWVRIIEPNAPKAFALAFTCFLLTWPHTYTAIQMRQPLVFVLLFIILAIFMINFSKNRFLHIISGMLLFLSTAKPQNCILAIAYILIIWLPSTKDKKVFQFVWLGFLIMAALSFMVTLWLVPGWIREFIQALMRYRDYAGTTGAESIWGNAWSSVGIPCLFAVAGICMSIVSFKTRQNRLHLLIFSYVLILQGLVFPSHLYAILMGMPIVALLLRRLIRWKDEANKPSTYVISAILILVFYAVYKYWIHIFSEAPLSGDVIDFFVAVKNYMPRVPLYAAIPLMLVLGIFLFMEAISESTGKLGFKDLVYLRR